MPTYEYRCARGHTFERFQRMTEKPIDRCPECGEAAERLMSAGAGLLFKGSGFYITDYRSESYKKAAAADGDGKPADKPSADKPSADKASTDKGSTDKPSAGKSDSGSTKPASGGSSSSAD